MLSTNKSKFYGRKPVGRFTLKVQNEETVVYPRDDFQKHMDAISKDYEFFEKARYNGVKLVKLAGSEEYFDIDNVIENIGGWFQRYDAIMCGEDVMTDKEGNPVQLTSPSWRARPWD